ncbi:acyl-CoA dehydrogenase family protein [Arvimicrobium flavum]|uniref:acyl-CoA dehydrogenase family protein n=1 Tax=Arvimicrobium flavum TaxID=3393320 RepID=UPI00237AC706|nr:acyl-CoA dehydrogenase family protein [Mesorhizobium shangrilense]
MIFEPGWYDRINGAEYQQLARSTRQFVDAELRDRAQYLDEREEFPEDLYQMMARLGLFGITIPTDMGGVGADVRAYSVVMEELSRGYASVADQCGLLEMVGSLLATHGTRAQQEAYLRPMLRFERKCAYAITEPEAGSDVGAITTTAHRTAKGWRLEGGKIWIHNAPVADFAIVLALTDKEAGKRGMSIFIVDADRPGYGIGPKEFKMGQRASQVGALTFDAIDLPPEALLGEEGRGFQMMMSVLDKGRVGIASLSVGILQAAIEASIEYAKMRHQFGKPISDFQAIQWMIADMAQSLQASRLLVLDAAARLDAGEDATVYCSIAKCYAADAAVRHVSDAVQIHGGIGFIRGIEVERLYRDAKITQIYEGTNQIQRQIIARHLLK